MEPSNGFKLAEHACEKSKTSDLVFLFMSCHCSKKDIIFKNICATLLLGNKLIYENGLFHKYCLRRPFLHDIVEYNVVLSNFQAEANKKNAKEEDQTHKL